MNRDDVESWLDLQVMAGRMSPELKEEKLREFDMRVAQGNSAPFEKPQVQSNYLNGPEMIVIFIMAIAITVAAVKDKGTLLIFLAGILFAYIGIKILIKDIKDGKGVSYIPVIAGLCGIGMLAFGVFQLIGTKEMKETYESYTGTLACVSVIVVGAGIIIGNVISRIKTKNKYTQPVKARCIQLISPRNASSLPRKLTPVYEFYYNGETRRIMNSFFSNRGNPQVGEEREIFINHEADGYYDPKRSNTTTICLVGLSIFFICMGILLLIL